MTCKILGLFVNTLPVDDKYSLLNRDNLAQPIQMQLSQKQKTFLESFSVFFKYKLNFEHFQKKMTVIGELFRKLRAPKNVFK